MPRKIRELEEELRRVGFVKHQGKGNHRNWKHPQSKASVTVSGNPGDDVPYYLEKQVRKAVKKANG